MSAVTSDVELLEEAPVLDWWMRLSPCEQGKVERLIRRQIRHMVTSRWMAGYVWHEARRIVVSHLIAHEVDLFEIEFEDYSENYYEEYYDGF